MIKKLTLALLFTLPSLTFAVDLDSFYITPKVGVSKSMDAGETLSTNHLGLTFNSEDTDIGTGTAFGFSVGKYITDNFRMELEAMKRTGYDFDALIGPDYYELADKATINTTSIFINGFYDFQPFSIGNTPITPYLGGGVGISRNKMGFVTEYNNLGANTWFLDGDSTNEFAYKFSAGTLVSLTEKLSLDVNYQYVNLGAFKSGSAQYNSLGVPSGNMDKGINGGEIKTQELMVGLQYTFK